MNLRDLQKHAGRGIFVKLAEQVGTAPSYISQCAIGARKPSVKMARRLVAADRRLTLPALRPDIYGKAA